MPGVTVDGNDPLAVRAAVADAADRARAGEGPTLIEALTYRLYGHVFGDRMTYLPPDELDAAWRDEPVGRFRRHLLEAGALTDDGARRHRGGVRPPGGRHPGRGPRPCPSPDPTSS